MGQVSLLVSVFGGETVKPERELLLVTCDNYDYYSCYENGILMSKLFLLAK